jgi:hypothetical protein
VTELLPFATWVPILDGDATAAAMYERHYSSARSRARRQARGTMLFLGPGEKLVLMTPCRRALFAWRLERYRASGQAGVECAVFRNEGAGLSSDLIRAADAIADARWPGERKFTHVDPRAVQSSNPGFCFLKAGWERCGVTKSRRLVILQRCPAAVRLAA